MPSTSLWKRLTAWLTASPPPQAIKATTPTAPTKSAHTSHKEQRAQRREQLFGLVRENMIRAGVLSSAYKFKVLTLDSLGQSFIVLIDVQGRAFKHDAATLAHLESQLQSLCHERLDLTVKNVYWRIAVDESIEAPPTAEATAKPNNPAPASEQRLEHAQSLLMPGRGTRPTAPASPAPGYDRDFAPTQPLPPYPEDPDPLSETQYGRLE